MKCESNERGRFTVTRGSDFLGWVCETEDESGWTAQTVGEFRPFPEVYATQAEAVARVVLTWGL